MFSGQNAPACCLALNAMSSSSSSPAGFFLGFLLWMGFVPAAYGQRSFCLMTLVLQEQCEQRIEYRPPIPEGMLAICESAWACC